MTKRNADRQRAVPVPDRVKAEVIAYADVHSTRQAAVKYGVSVGTIRSWRSRSAKPKPTPPPDLTEQAPDPASLPDLRARLLAAATPTLPGRVRINFYPPQQTGITMEIYRMAHQQRARR
jgi:hypothetical protein